MGQKQPPQPGADRVMIDAMMMMMTMKTSKPKIEPHAGAAADEGGLRGWAGATGAVVCSICAISASAAALSPPA